jgi:hypothetical protein
MRRRKFSGTPVGYRQVDETDIRRLHRRVYGHVERVVSASVPVVHLIVPRPADQSALLGQLTVPSRDFH